MKLIVINSDVNGKQSVLVDDQDYDLIAKRKSKNRNLTAESV